MNTIKCSRCDTNVDMHIGMKIIQCLAPVDKARPFRGHIIGWDTSTVTGAKAMLHLERKPQKLNMAKWGD